MADDNTVECTGGVEPCFSEAIDLRFSSYQLVAIFDEVVPGEFTFYLHPVFIISALFVRCGQLLNHLFLEKGFSLCPLRFFWKMRSGSIFVTISSLICDFSARYVYNIWRWAKRRIRRGWSNGFQKLCFLIVDEHTELLLNV